VDTQTEGKDEEDFPLHGFGTRLSIPLIDGISDSQLEEFNKYLPWNAFVADANGRRFGNRSSPTKRSAPSPIPDRRAIILNQKNPLTGQRVLEVGCFEGIHTVSLDQFGADVWACDARIVNVMKSAVRAACFNVRPHFFVWDVELPLPQTFDLRWDVLYHVGVLYHLLNPIKHLKYLLPRINKAVFLDTHVAPLSAETVAIENGFSYRYLERIEPGYEFVFAGTQSRARWIRLEDLVSLLKQTGFPRVEVIEQRDERHGPRAMVYAERDITSPST